jgi:replication-associated recombination protein RarA
MKAFTEHGYHLAEVISAIQKEIRRGNERSALYWAFHLVPRYEQYLWRRLLVIANEDIGLGNPQVLYSLPALREQWFEFRSLGKNGTCRLILANAILLLCRSPKSRLADHMQRAVSQEFMDAPQRPIPDHALDKHTGRGRAAGRGVAHWLEEGCKLEPVADIDDPYAQEAQSHWLSGNTDAPEWGKRSPDGKLSGWRSDHQRAPDPQFEMEL